MPDQVSVAIDRDITAPAAARRAVERFGASLDPGVVPDVKLLVSELISNAVKYGREGVVRLVLRSEDPCHVHVEVVDQGVGFVPAARDRPKTEPGGWGLHMVEALTQRWGVREGSTHVWFEIDRRAAAGSAGAR
ncbi:MAG TPA: ATP-binding protein [Baekduia sp.]|uniref:ATP-binding protein n=1 Tax=Baekduia sp. TaxID=2600305 RepID=UPI002D77C9EB|nr:ATP-binding protein [Baekduia sp.]HET6506040.1 ATP-binding protein [Baekduia sp.]